VLNRHHLSGPSHSALDLIIHKKDSELLCQLVKLLMEFRRRDDIAALSLNGFDENGGHFLRRDAPLEEILSDPIDTGSAATGVLPMVIRATIAVGVRNMGDPGDEWIKSPLVNHFAGR
jgi:hypothetical protein